MRNIFFNDTLELELNVIGYKYKGETIVFFLRADGNVVYSGLVDCYEDLSGNIAVDLLSDANRKCFDFVCWTHPHDDHTIGMDKIITQYCSQETRFWMSPIAFEDYRNWSKSSKSAITELFSIINSRKRCKVSIKTANNFQILDKIVIKDISSPRSFSFEISSFAPDSNLLLKRIDKDTQIGMNLYSIGLLISIGEYKIMLAGDVENQTIDYIDDYYFNSPIDYIKIPHHSSDSSLRLIDKLKSLDIPAPNIAATTVYRIHNLPDKNVLKNYYSWHRGIEIYSTGDVDCAARDTCSVGIIQTTFDILEEREFAIETLLKGNAVKF